jgi:hypothetical protein
LPSSRTSSRDQKGKIAYTPKSHSGSEMSDLTR